MASPPPLLSEMASLSDPPPSQLDDRHRERIRTGFTFSRWFILTYQLAICAVILIAVAWRIWSWLAHRSRRKRRQREDDHEQRLPTGDVVDDNPGRAGESSSSHSSSKGTLILPDAKAYDERRPLLDRGAAVSSARSWSPWTILRSILMYQPPPVPLIHRKMPSNGASLLILSLLSLNLFYLLYRIDYYDVLSDRAGLLFVANLPWLYLLAAKNQPIQLLTGHSYENLNLLHRRLGELLCILALIHCFGMILAWYQFLRVFGLTLIGFLTIRYILFGVIAFFAYEILYFTSLASFREWWYEVFLGSHIFLQVAGLVLLWLHHFRGRPYVAVALGIFLIDRLVFRFGLKFRSFDAGLDVLEDGSTVRVSANWPIRSRWRNFWTSMTSWGIESGWRPTEHVFISVPAIGRKHVLQFHPITIASAAPARDHAHAWFNLLIRAKDGFSKDLLHYTQRHSTAKIWLDGPYGSSHALQMLHGSDLTVVVAGGSGIAVAYPLIWSLLMRRNDPEAAPFPLDLCLIWVIQDSRHLSWIGSERLDELKQLGLRVIIPPPTKKQGRPDVEALVRRHIDTASPPSASTHTSKIGVVVSGPDGLNRSVRNTCAQMTRRGYDIEVAVEEFGW